MTQEEWLTLFPQGKVTTSYPNNTTDVIIPINHQSYLIIDKATLTQREKAILSLCQQPVLNHTSTQTPWQKYLERGGQPPQNIETIQVIHVSILPKNHDFNEQEWLSVMSEVLGDTLSAFRCFHKHYTFILDTSTTLMTLETLTQIHETIEEDFAISMTIFLGNQWRTTEQLPQLYQAEKALFVSYLHSSNRQKQLDFPATIIWGMTQPKVDLTPIPNVLLEIIHHERTEEIIDALWKERGVLTKAAAHLFLHRNTLQYRIDKFASYSGLHLKNMDDLTLCYLLLHRYQY